MINSGQWHECPVCGATVRLGFETCRRERQTMVVTYENSLGWLSWTVGRQRNFEVQTLCVWCGEQEDAAIAARKQQRLLLLGGYGVGFYGWFKYGMVGLYGAGGAVVAFILASWLWRRHRAGRMQEQKQLYLEIMDRERRAE